MKMWTILSEGLHLEMLFKVDHLNLKGYIWKWYLKSCYLECGVFSYPEISVTRCKIVASYK